GDILIGRCAAVARIIASDRRELSDVQCLALGDTLEVRDVERDDITQLLLPGERRRRAADLAGADKRDLFASHEPILSGNSRGGAPLPRFVRPGKAGRRDLWLALRVDGSTHS